METIGIIHSGICRLQCILGILFSLLFAVKKLLKDNNKLFFLKRVTFQQLAIFFRVTCNVVHLSAQPNNFLKICQVGLFSVCKSALSPPHSLEIRKVF